MTDRATEPVPLPLANSYWVQPGRLLAGEYPGSMFHADAMERIRQLLHAGIDSFVDLTEEGELPSYDGMLSGLTEQQIRYRRLPIVDHDLPRSAEYMSMILDRIDEELTADRKVYVHCHAGIGRTGMTVACHLIRHGLDNQEALQRLQDLWRQCARSQRWPRVPETSEQEAFVQHWRDAPGAGEEPASLEARYQGALVGLALGEAFGMLASGNDHDAAAAVMTCRNSRPLVTGMHTATTLAAAESLLVRAGHDPHDQMRRYLQWSRDAAAPAAFKRALAAWQWSGKPHAGSHDPTNLDPHSLPRTLAAALYSRSDVEAAIELAAELSRTTQQSPLVLDLCRLWAGLLIDALEGVDRDVLLSCEGPAVRKVRRRSLKPAIEAYLVRHRSVAGAADDGHRRAGSQPGASDRQSALFVTGMALKGFALGADFREVMTWLTTELRGPPAAAAMGGALAGAHYGIDAIPVEWRQQLAEGTALCGIARRLSAVR